MTRAQRYVRCGGCNTLLLHPSNERAPDQDAHVEELTIGMWCCPCCRKPAAPPPRPPAPPPLTVSLEELEQLALASEYKTVPGAYGSVLVGGQDLLALVRLLRFYSQARCGCINTQLCETWGAHNAV